MIGVVNVAVNVAVVLDERSSVDLIGERKRRDTVFENFGFLVGLTGDFGVEDRGNLGDTINSDVALVAVFVGDVFDHDTSVLAAARGVARDIDGKWDFNAFVRSELASGLIDGNPVHNLVVARSILQVDSAIIAGIRAVGVLAIGTDTDFKLESLL